MKKLLTSVLTLALILCCFTFVGCKNEDDPGLTIGQTLEICERFITDIKAVDTKISVQDYIYPTIDAQASAKQVADTDKSSIGVEYSNYDEFDYDEEFHEYLWPFSVKELYLYADSDARDLKIYINMYKDNNWQLQETYKFYYDAEKDMPMYIQLINYNNTKISLLIAVEEDGETYYEEYTINLNTDLSWKSFEYKQYSTEGDKDYLYIEKANDSNRVFNRYIEGDIYTTSCRIVDINEETQKTLYLEEFSTSAMTSIQSTAHIYLLNLNIQNVQYRFHIENAIETEVYFDGYYVD